MEKKVKKLKIKMSLAMVKKHIKDAGIEIFREERLPDDNGTQITTILSHIVNHYDNGTVFPQGHNPEQMRKILLKKGNER
jgi:hypothetical protein